MRGKCGIISNEEEREIVLNAFLGILTGIIVFSFMMFVHELGHYLVARALGFKIVEFSIFMGPRLFSVTRKGIRYSLKLIPIGASVSFAGEYGEDEDDEFEAAEEVATERIETDEPGANASVPGKSKADADGLFYKKPRWARGLVLSAGSAFNIISGLLALIIYFASLGYALPILADNSVSGQAAAAGLQAGDRIERLNGHQIRNDLDLQLDLLFASADQPLEVEFFRPADGKTHKAVLQPERLSRYMLGISHDIRYTDGGLLVTGVDASSNAGNPVIRTGDVIKSIDGTAVNQQNSAQLINASQGREIKLIVERDGRETELSTLPSLYQYYSERGIHFEIHHEFWRTIPYSLEYSASIVKATARSIGKLFIGDLKVEDTLSGPIGVVDMISGVVTADVIDWGAKLSQLLMLFALISLSLGIMNLLPILPLDGGHLLLLAIETLRGGKKLSVRVQNVMMIFGLIIILILFILGIYSDVARIFSR